MRVFEIVWEIERRHSLDLERLQRICASGNFGNKEHRRESGDAEKNQDYKNMLHLL
jgi:hypothetical protein